MSREKLKFKLNHLSRRYSFELENKIDLSTSNGSQEMQESRLQT